MFTGIVEACGRVVSLERKQGNLIAELSCPFTSELKIDQSLAHNGVCLTVMEISSDSYKVVAIEETLSKTNLDSLKSNDIVNLERCMLAGGRLDGHIVQGHVDQTGTCIEKKDLNGSWSFKFNYAPSPETLVVKKGSICVNGVSLTVADCGDDWFTVAIIPYTYEHTSFSSLNEGDKVNLEFDIVGKYLSELTRRYFK
jgi:riboflavin synthase